MSTRCYQPNEDRHTSQRHRVIEGFGTTEASPPKWRVHDPWETFKRQFSREEFQFEVTWMLLWSEIWTHDFNWHVAFSRITVTPFLSWAMRHQQAIFFSSTVLSFPVGLDCDVQGEEVEKKQTAYCFYIPTNKGPSVTKTYFTAVSISSSLSLFFIFSLTVSLLPCHFFWKALIQNISAKVVTMRKCG